MSARRNVPRQPKNFGKIRKAWTPAKSQSRLNLEKEVAAEQRRVGARISRLKTQKDIQVKESGLDPRMPLREVRNLSRGELQRYRKSLQEFKQTEILRGARGSAIPAKQFAELQKLDSAFNALSEAHDANVGNLTIPTLGRTIEQRRSDLEKGKDGETRLDRSRGGKRTFEKIKHSVENIENFGGGLQKLIEQARQKLEPGYVGSSMKVARETINEMLQVAGDEEFQERVNALDDFQLEVMVNETDFMRNAAARYKAGISGNVKAKGVPESEVENAGSNIDTLLNWAGSLEQRADGTIAVRAPKPEPRSKSGRSRAGRSARGKGRKS